MKKPIKQLDVDFIGGDTPLTPAEEKLISSYLAKKKLSKIKQARKIRITTKTKKNL